MDHGLWPSAVRPWRTCACSEAEDLQVKEAGLAGESAAITKAAETVAPAALLAERSSMYFMGTTVQAGRSRGVVVATARDTEMGRIADLTAAAEQTQAPLQQGLDQRSRRLAIGVVLGAAALFGLGVMRCSDMDEMLEIAVTLEIAVVPRGCPPWRP